jgi:hypothetical protein
MLSLLRFSSLWLITKNKSPVSLHGTFVDFFEETT